MKTVVIALGIAMVLAGCGKAPAQERNSLEFVVSSDHNWSDPTMSCIMKPDGKTVDKCHLKDGATLEQVVQIMLDEHHKAIENSQQSYELLNAAVTKYLRKMRDLDAEYESRRKKSGAARR